MLSEVKSFLHFFSFKLCQQLKLEISYTVPQQIRGRYDLIIIFIMVTCIILFKEVEPSRWLLYFFSAHPLSERDEFPFPGPWDLKPHEFPWPVTVGSSFALPPSVWDPLIRCWAPPHTPVGLNIFSQRCNFPSASSSIERGPRGPPWWPYPCLYR